MSKISIVVPVYKVEEYLSRCVESILNQTFKDFELILVDDGSPDNCGKICDEYALKDSRIKVIHKKNGGLSDARNAGIDWTFDNSDSEWITFIDSDDWVHPQYLEILYNAVISNNTFISTGNYVKTSEFTEFVAIKNHTSDVFATGDFFMRFIDNAVVAWGKLYKKTLFKNIRYPYGKIHEDEFTTHKLLFQCDKIVFLPDVLYFYFTNDDGIMSSQWNNKEFSEVPFEHTLNALSQRISFFKKLKNTDVLEWQLDRYIETIRFYYDFINRKYHSTDYLKKLRNRMRILLIKYLFSKKFPIGKYSCYYEIAFPLFMKYYWIIKTKIFKR